MVANLEAESEAYTSQELQIQLKFAQYMRHIDAGELFKRLYARPDYREVIKTYTTVLVKMLQEDPELMEAFLRLLEDHDIELSDDRLPVVIPAAVAAKWIIGGIATGGVIGFASGFIGD